MKKQSRKLLSLLLVLALVLTLVPTNVVAAKKVKLNKSKVTLYVGKTTTLKVKGTSKKVTWSSSNKKVATVNKKGKVTAKKKGTATITAKVSGKKYKCKVTVKKKAHTHKYTTKVIKPTCTEKGYTLYTCSCGVSYKDNYKNNTSHTWTEWKTTKQATESNEGEQSRTCSSCKSIETKRLDKLPHSHSYEETVIKPTCTEQGYTLYKCKCGDSYNDNYTEASHSWTDWVITKDPGTEVHTLVFTDVLPFGERTRTCNRCKKEEKQSIINIDASAYDENDILTASGIHFISENIAQVYGVFHDDMAYETLALINNLRKSVGVSELTWNNGFTNFGKVRSSELSIKYSHDRPNGNRVQLRENAAMGLTYYSAQEVFNDWKNSQGHYNNMISDVSLYYASCFECEDGSFYWIQLFQ